MIEKKKEPKKLTAKQQAKADALTKKLGLVGDVTDLAAVKILAKQADERAKDFAKYLAIISPKRKAPAKAQA